MKVHILGSGSGDPDLLTVKAWRCLQAAEVCLVSFRSLDPRLKDLIPTSTQLINVSHSSLDDMLASYQCLVDKGQSFVHLLAGDPCLYEPLQPCVSWLKNRKIEFEVVAGISAYQALAARLASELTVYKGSQSVVITRIKGDCQMPSCQEISALAASKSTLCIYFANKYSYDGWGELEKYYGSSCPAIVGKGITGVSEKIERLNVGELAKYFSNVSTLNNAPMVVIIGEALKDVL